MATVVNTVQGFNETIGLLKQILSAVSNDGKKGSKGDDKAVQVKDVSSSAILLSKIDKNGSDNIKSVILAFEPLEKMGNNIDKKANAIANAIKSITDKNIVEGLGLYANVTPKIINNVFNVITTVVNSFAELGNKIDIKKLQSVSEVIKNLQKSIESLTRSLYLMAGLILVSALVGVIAVFAWKFILAGFAAILGTTLLLIGVSKLLTKVANITQETNRNILAIIISIYALSSIVIVSALVGVLAIYAWKFVLTGFATIVGIVLGIFAVIGVIKMINAAIKIAATKFGSKGFLKHLLKGNFDSPMPEEVKNIIYALGALAMIPFISALVGVIAINYFGIIMTGFGTISLMLIGLLSIIKFMGEIKGSTKEAINTAYSLSILMLALTLVLLGLVGISVVINHFGLTWQDLAASVVSMMALMLTVGVLLKIVGSVKPSAKSILAMVLIVVIMGFLTLLMFSITDLTNKVQEAGGWGKIFIALAAMVGFVVAVGLLMAGIGALMTIPPVAAAIAIGGAVIAGISVVVLLLSAAIKSIITAYKECESVGLDKLPTMGASLASALTGFVTSIASKDKGLGSVGLFDMVNISLMMRPISNIINTTSKFIKMISSFSTEDCGADELRYINYDEKTGKYTVGNKINIKNAGIAIAKGFGGFISSLNESLTKFTNAEKEKFNTIAETNLLPIIDSCSSFIKMISSIAGVDGENLSYYLTDSKGNFVQDSKGNYIQKSVNLSNAAKIISKGFGVFIRTLSTELIKMSNKEKRRLKKLGESNIMPIIEATTKFVEMISNIVGNGEINPNSGIINVLQKDKNGNYIYEGKEIKTRQVNLKKAGETIASSLGVFISSLSGKLPNPSNLENFANNFGKISNSFEKITNSIFKIDDEKSKKLKQYTEAINKFAEAVGKVSESIDTLNEKKIDLKLDELRDSLNMKIGANVNVNTNSSSNNSSNNNSNNNTNNINHSGGNIGIDMNAISNAIVEGFKKIDIIRVELDNTNKYHGMLYVE